jgi:UDP-N-acetylmuramyl pentapeptide phosphotransferase/UDP-N-acetylglucosamine-1-phosphate transferase
MLLELIASCLLVVGIPLARRWVSRSYKILDKPWHDVPKRSRVPTLQGIGSVAAVVITTLLFRSELLTEPYMIGLRVGLALLVTVNFIDELWRLVHPKYRLSPKIKFIIQVGAALIALRVSDVGFTEFAFGGTIYTFW